MTKRDPLLTTAEWDTVNRRFHMAQDSYGCPFVLWWNGADRTIHVRTEQPVKRRVAIPAGARCVGVYDHRAKWQDVKADLVAIASEAA